MPSTLGLDRTELVVEFDYMSTDCGSSDVDDTMTTFAGRTDCPRTACLYLDGGMGGTAIPEESRIYSIGGSWWLGLVAIVTLSWPYQQKSGKAGSHASSMREFGKVVADGLTTSNCVVRMGEESQSFWSTLAPERCTGGRGLG